MPVTEPGANLDQRRVEPELDEDSRGYLDAHLESIRRKIVKRAVELAKQEDSPHPPLDLTLVERASDDFAPGTRVPAPVEPKESWGDRLKAGITGVTIIAAVLAVIFGGLAIINPINGQQTGFLDLAKLLTGAIVGSTGAAVATGTKKR